MEPTWKHLPVFDNIRLLLLQVKIMQALACAPTGYQHLSVKQSKFFELVRFRASSLKDPKVLNNAQIPQQRPCWAEGCDGISEGWPDFLMY